MFYSDNYSESFRLGDIITGFTDVVPAFDSEPYNYTIKVNTHDYYAIMTPCCSIEKGVIAIASLLNLNNIYLLSEYLKKDFTRINQFMNRRQAMGELLWDMLKEPEKIKNLESPPQYEYKDILVYESNKILKD
jgi:hypothetical protein